MRLQIYRRTICLAAGYFQSRAGLDKELKLKTVGAHSRLDISVRLNLTA